ncbi:MAG TPA: hypothetical protein VLE02_02745 [Nitrosarchaeum sp.]|nr:hypothetical protein [Nitrosarchaeum sp.]
MNKLPAIPIITALKIALLTLEATKNTTTPTRIKAIVLCWLRNGILAIILSMNGCTIGTRKTEVAIAITSGLFIMLPRVFVAVDIPKAMIQLKLIWYFSK